MLNQYDYQAEIFDSVMNIDAKEWHSLINPELDLAMDQRLISHLENCLKDQAQFWTVTIKNSQGKMVCCACLSLFKTDIVQSAPPVIINILKKIRKYWPNFLKMKVLFCGLPVPSGHTHLRIDPQEDFKLILSKINQQMMAIARRNKASLLVFKELNQREESIFQDLQCLGFIRGELEPTFQLSHDFKDFADYHQAMRSPYKRQVQVNINKFKQSGLTVAHFTDAQTIYDQFTDQVYQLYLNVWERAKEKLECYPPSFFRELAKLIPGQVSFVLISHENKPTAFTFGIFSHEQYYNLYSGLDYDYLEKADLYFNLFYHELDVVFNLNKKKISLGQTSAMFKSRLGAIADPRFFLVRPLNPILLIIFKYFQKLIFPKLKPMQPYQVFRKEYYTKFSNS